MKLIKHTEEEIEFIKLKDSTRREILEKFCIPYARLGSTVRIGKVERTKCVKQFMNYARNLVRRIK